MASHHATPGAPSIDWRTDTIPQDYQAVREIVDSTGFFLPTEMAVAQELVQERLAKGGASGYEFLFAECHQQVVGYGCYGEIGCTSGSYDLYWIAVRQDYQGRGIGKQLLGRIEALIQRHRGRHLYIETSNRPQYEPTRNFYLAQDYEIVSILPDFYRPGDDKVTFRKVL